MNKKFVFSLLVFSTLTIVQSAFAQDVFQHVSNKNIYDFLDEMANIKMIEVNSVIKPYSRIYIAMKLSEIDFKKDQLNLRQKNELYFYLKDYNKEIKPDKKFDKRADLFYYKDSLFTFSINPVLGIQYWKNENGANYHRWNGAEIFAYVGKHLGIYANLRDNHEKDSLSRFNYLTKRPGVKYKDGLDFSEMRGGITLSNDWGSFGLVKDHFEWGNYYSYPGIFSSKAPSFTHLKLNLKPVKWFEFNYIHAWLQSGIVDSLRSYTFANSYGTSQRTIYRKKFLAANMFTFKPLKNLYTSIGNSIIYSDDGVNPAYLIPVFLYKSVDHTQNTGGGNMGGQNSQFYIDISSRQINHLHLYSTIFFDDISITRLKENGHFDYYSFKGGFRLSDFIPNTNVTFEYFQSYPLVYKHITPTTTYESNFFNLGHYLQDNSREFYIDLSYHPIRGGEIKAWWCFAEHGQDHESIGTDRIAVVEMFMDSIEWKNNTFGISATYQIVNDVYAYFEVVQSNISGNINKYTPKFFRNSKLTYSFAVNIGF